MSSSSRVTVRSVRGGGGTTIAYQVWEPHAAADADPADEGADPSGPTLLLVHGWAQDARSWGDDVLTALASERRVIAMDLRGHGSSQTPDAPVDPGDPTHGWTEADFAQDVDAVLHAEAPTDGVVIVGWSYGGLVSCDYLAGRRQTDPAVPDVLGLVLVGAITSLGPGRAGGTIGSAMRVALPDAASADPRTALRGLASLGTALVPAGRPDLGALSQHFFGVSLATPPAARSGLFARTADHDDLLRGLSIPVLIVHGTDDTVVDVASARHAESLIPDVHTDYWESEGHAPFATDPERFVESVLHFVAGLSDSGLSDSGLSDSGVSDALATGAR